MCSFFVSFMWFGRSENDAAGWEVIILWPCLLCTALTLWFLDFLTQNLFHAREHVLTYIFMRWGWIWNFFRWCQQIARVRKGKGGRDAF